MDPENKLDTNSKVDMGDVSQLKGNQLIEKKNDKTDAAPESEKIPTHYSRAVSVYNSETRDCSPEKTGRLAAQAELKAPQTVVEHDEQSGKISGRSTQIRNRLSSFVRRIRSRISNHVKKDPIDKSVKGRQPCEDDWVSEGENGTLKMTQNAHDTETSCEKPLKVWEDFKGKEWGRTDKTTGNRTAAKAVEHTESVDEAEKIVKSKEESLKSNDVSEHTEETTNAIDDKANNPKVPETPKEAVEDTDEEEPPTVDNPKLLETPKEAVEDTSEEEPPTVDNPKLLETPKEAVEDTGEEEPPTVDNPKLLETPKEAVEDTGEEEPPTVDNPKLLETPKEAVEDTGEEEPPTVDNPKLLETPKEAVEDTGEEEPPTVDNPKLLETEKEAVENTDDDGEPFTESINSDDGIKPAHGHEEQEEGAVSGNSEEVNDVADNAQGAEKDQCAVFAVTSNEPTHPHRARYKENFGNNPTDHKLENTGADQHQIESFLQMNERGTGDGEHSGDTDSSEHTKTGTAYGKDAAADDFNIQKTEAVAKPANDTTREGTRATANTPTVKGINDQNLDPTSDRLSAAEVNQHIHGMTDDIPCSEEFGQTATQAKKCARQGKEHANDNIDEENHASKDIFGHEPPGHAVAGAEAITIIISCATDETNIQHPSEIAVDGVIDSDLEEQQQQQRQQPQQQQQQQELSSQRSDNSLIQTTGTSEEFPEVEEQAEDRADQNAQSEGNVAQAQHGAEGPSQAQPRQSAERTLEESVALRSQRRWARVVPVVGARMASQVLAVVDLANHCVDQHCPIDVSRNAECLEQIHGLERFQLRPFFDSVNAEAVFMDQSNLLQDWLNGFTNRVREENQTCLSCGQHQANTVLLNCHHIVLCWGCANYTLRGSCCPLPACAAPILCFIYIG